jgi:ubiquinone/menaquinone biosynthesis C-methylase UbiE
MSARRSAPSAARNRDAIERVLREVMPPRGAVLELAAGSGEHARWYAEAWPELSWQPTDRDPAALASIDAWREGGPDNLLPAKALDAHDPDAWPAPESVDVVLCVNMIHIAPFSACEAVMDGAARVLRPNGALFLYGAYKRGGAHTAPSNEEFDRWLKAQDPRFGVRDLEAVTARAAQAGLRFDRLWEMPANNLSVLFRRP